jgi:lipopolysaccharide export system ATP-binding protein
MTLLIADSVGKRYGRKSVLTSASLRAEEGSICALLGRNGAGKTTLLSIAAGVLSPDHGVIIWREQRMQRSRTWRLARDGLMLLPADGFLSPSIRLRDQLRLFTLTYGAMSIDSILERMHLTDRADEPVCDLSGGELRRAEIAAALARNPACLLADEVFRGLAPVDADLVGETLRSMAANGCGVVVAGHEVPFLMRYADRITWCTSGTTRELATPSEALALESFGQGYLGTHLSRGANVGVSIKPHAQRLQAELNRTERQRAIAECEAERARARDLIRTWLECLVSCVAGLLVIGSGAYVEDRDVGKILVLAGLMVALAGATVSVYASYVRGVARGDW